MLKLDNFYLHAICANDNFSIDKTLIKLENILKDKYILSRKKQGDIDPNRGGWNGLDFISLCDYSNRNAQPYNNDKFYQQYNSYNAYINLSLSLILNKANIKTIKPILLPPAIFDFDSIQEMHYLGNCPNKRYTDMPDEVQVKDKVSLQNLEAITIPILKIANSNKSINYNKNMLVEFLMSIRCLLKIYNYIKPIYDLGTSNELNSEEDIINVLRIN